MKNNRYKPLIIAAVGLLFFGIFIFLLISCESTLSKAKKELIPANKYELIKNIWIKYEVKLGNKPEWETAVIEKLKSVSMTQQQEEDAMEWLHIPTNLNLVVVPDLSGRIKPKGQIETDKRLLSHIWDGFRERSIANYTLQNKTTKDRLILDITPDPILLSKLDINENALVFDASKAGVVNRKYLDESKGKFLQNVDAIYNFSKDSTRGADYYQYLSAETSKFAGNQSKSTWYNKYENMLIIITDGYLEINKPGKEEEFVRYTGDESQLKQIRNRPQTQSLQAAIAQQKFKITGGAPPSLNGWKVMIVEVQPRESQDYPILKQLWYDWLKSGNAQLDDNAFFLQHQLAPVTTENAINDFLKVNVRSSVKPTTTITSVSKSPSNDVSQNQYDILLSQAEQAVKKQDMTTAKVLLRNANKIRDANNLLRGEHAENLYNSYVTSADRLFSTLKKAKAYEEMDIPADWYELAALIKNDDTIQAKLAECRRFDK